MLVSGSVSAFEELYVRHKSRLMYFCKRFLKNDDLAEDLIQDVFIKIWDTKENLDPDLSFAKYLHISVQNRILNMFRQFDVHSRFADSVIKAAEQANNQTECQVIDNDYAALLDMAIETLSPRQREVFYLSRTMGLTYREIAKSMQISVPMVQQHASIALEKIRKHLKLHTDIDFKTIIACLIAGEFFH